MYRILISDVARRKFRRLDRGLQNTIDEKIASLSEWPEVAAQPMWGGARGHFRMKARDRRIIFRVDQKNNVIRIEDIGHRAAVYERFH